MDYPNRRKFPRIASEALLEISHPAFGIINLKAKNASKGGFFALRSSQPLPPKHTQVQVIIRRHKGIINDVPVAMRVVRVTDEGIGLAFI